ncbi:MAG: hypothetical protein LBB82_04215 [Treponema sp.]|jgi:hypothetical protein|nr:hypothetical protein [Treponema sp.]
MELRILEFFAAAFLVLSIIRPLIRGLWRLDGISALPLLAFAIIIGAFAAYDFRPECVPLLVCAIFLAFANMTDFLALFSRIQSDSYLDRSLVFTLLSAAACAFVVWIAFFFAPPLDMGLSAAGVETITLRNYRQNTLVVRIYGPVPPETGSLAIGADSVRTGGFAEGPAEGEAGELHPLLILIPPAAGSIQAVDQVCLALRDRGFSVLSYSRPGFDSPAINSRGEAVRLGFTGLYRLVNALWRGCTDVKANEGGRGLEAERRADAEFLVRELRENRTLRDKFHDTDFEALVLAGYGAGGAAVTELAADVNFTAGNSGVRCVAALEAPILSALEGEALPAPPRYSGAAGELFNRLRDFVLDITPRKITHAGRIPQSTLPLLLVVSGRVIHRRTGRYETVLRALGASRAPALLAAVPGAGPFDYSDSPRIYPIYSFLFRGEEGAPSEGGPELTAALITNFAANVLGTGTLITAPPAGGEARIPPEYSALYTEVSGSWETPPRM